MYKLNNVKVNIFLTTYKNHIPIKILDFHLINNTYDKTRCGRNNIK